VSGSTVAFSWTAPAGETVTSYVLEAGSASGLANLLQLNTGTPTAVTFQGVPPGRYYVRVRAVNDLGLGTASNEVAIIVP
jgi:predicted phage tail protein